MGTTAQAAEQGCETNLTYIAAKKAKHLEDSETTPKYCLDEVFKLLETRSQTSSQNSLSESVRLLQPSSSRKAFCNSTLT